VISRTAHSPSLRGRTRSSSARQGRKLKESRREDVERSLEQIFLAEGFSGLTVDDLAMRLQCSKSTLYSIASSREQLVLRIIRHFFRDAAARVEARTAEITDPPNQIAVYLASIGREMARMTPACYEDMMNFEGTRDIYELNSNIAAKRVRELIVHGIAKGSFRRVNTDFVGEAVSILIDGILHGGLLSRTGLSVGQAYVELGNLVLAALARHGQLRRNKVNS
jgi:AcrR family transcriptional regulator